MTHIELNLQGGRRVLVRRQDVIKVEPVLHGVGAMVTLAGPGPVPMPVRVSDSYDWLKAALMFDCEAEGVAVA